MLSGEPRVLLCLYSKADLLHDVYLSLNSDKRDGLLAQQRGLLNYIDYFRRRLVLTTGSLTERSKLPRLPLRLSSLSGRNTVTQSPISIVFIFYFNDPRINQQFCEKQTSFLTRQSQEKMYKKKISPNKKFWKRQTISRLVN